MQMRDHIGEVDRHEKISGMNNQVVVQVGCTTYKVDELIQCECQEST